MLYKQQGSIVLLIELNTNNIIFYKLNEHIVIGKVISQKKYFK